MGKKLADFKQEYSRDKFVGGISKAFFFLLGLVLIYGSTIIFPMEVAEINGEMVTTLTGTTILLKAANLLYACKVLMKIKNLLSVNVPINFLDENKKGDDSNESK